MEPMNLGSPVHSPTNPLSSLYLGSPGSSYPAAPAPSSSGYLPGFLLGESSLMSPTSPVLNRSMISPNKLNRSLSCMSSGSGLPASTPQTPLPSTSTRGPGLLKENAMMNRSQARSEKPGGPPTTSLLGSLSPAGGASTPGRFGTPVRPDPAASLSTSQAQDLQDPLATWVTVFGFPPAAASFVLTQLGSCGTVLQHVLPPNANWMHVRFQTRLQAKKAISKNGSILGGTIMVGISSCREESVLECPGSSSSFLLDSSLANTSVANISTGLGTPRSIRPLTQAFKDAQSDIKVVPNTQTPNKDTGLVSKAMEYMFGW